MLALTGDIAAIPMVGSLAARAVAGGRPTPIITPVLQEYARLMLTGEGPYWRIPLDILRKLFSR